LPIYADSILHTGALGLGLLRAAPAIGALVIALYLARRPIEEKIGKAMFAGVIGFGITTIIFAVSTSFWLSFGSLIVMGAADMVSVVIRSSLVQLETPHEMRGRVGAVNSIFIGASNQLGEFESGVTAAWVGVVPSVVLGGVGTLAIVAIWIKLFPELYHRNKLIGGDSGN
jgi:MFS family permease